MSSVGVIYLVWVPLGLQPLESFLASYTRHPAAVPHEMIVIFNGHKTPAELAPFHECLSDFPHTPHLIEQPQQDIASYLDVARTSTREYLCFLNSYSELQAPGWLQKLYQPLEAPTVGLVGATGSWQSHQIVVPFWELRTWLYYRLHNRRWPAFPNPHIRSTGFMLARETMLRLSLPPIRTKKDAYHFESGFGSMTRQIQSWNLQTLLVDRYGTTFEPPDWAQTRTFRSGDQSQLLITDNRTREYQNADADAQYKMRRMAWGDSTSPAESGTIIFPSRL